MTEPRKPSTYFEGRKDMALKERLMKGSIYGNGTDQEGLSLCFLFFDKKNRCSQAEGRLMRVDEGRGSLLLLLWPDEFKSRCRRAASM